MRPSSAARPRATVLTVVALVAASLTATPATATTAVGPMTRGPVAALPAIGPAEALLTVNSTGDSADLTPGDGACDTGLDNSEMAPECTLRAAITEANAMVADVAIEFAVPPSDPGHASGVWTIGPATRFDSLTDPVTIDGLTQPGNAGTPVVHIDGSSLTVDLANSGFAVDETAIGTVIRGLSITGFGNDGIHTRADGVVVEDNYIGVEPDGVTAPGNASEGVVVFASSAGAIIRDNLFGGHPNAAVALNGDSTGAVVQGNRFGTDSTGTVSMPNSQAVWSDTSGTALIGGMGPGEGNVIANSTWNAIEIHGATARMAILGNDIRASGALGIDLGGDGVTANDAADTDGGTNDQLNFPVLDAALAAEGTIEIDFTLDVPAGDYRIEFFTNPSGLDPSGYGEGETFAGFVPLAHLGGSRSFTADIPGTPGALLTATATRLLAGPIPDVTSELSAGIAAVAPTTLTVNSTGDGTDLVPGNAVCDTGLLNTGGSAECTLRAALQEANAAPDTNVIRFAIPTTEAGYQPTPVAWVISPGSALPAATGRTIIDAATQPEWLSEGRPVVQLDGSGAGSATGVRLSGANSLLRGLSIGNFTGAGVVVTGAATTVVGNHIGIDPVGTTETPNTGLGVDVNADRSVIGGTDPFDRNVIAGNQNTAVSVVGYDDVSVVGNYIGTDVTGLVVMINGGTYAVQAAVGDRLRVGGTAVGAGNVIGGYWGGIGLGSGADAVVEGNLIGIGSDGATPLPNTRGISLSGGTGHRIGGRTPQAGNVVANSIQEGVNVGGATDSVIEGNIVGTASDRVTAAPNDHGITVTSGSGTLIGGSAAGAGNLVAGNAKRGLQLSGGIDTSIQGNTIRANGWQGIYASSGAADQVTIGGTAPGEGNTITKSGNIGLVLQVGTYGGITALGNSIHGNGSIGIDHNWDGVSVNDPGDVDAGPNGLLNHPEITSAMAVGGSVSADFSLDVPAGDYRVEFFTNPGGPDPSGYGEGEVFAGATTVSHAGLGSQSFSATFAGSAGDVVAATATEQTAGPDYGSTSEFSPITAVAAPVTLVVNTTDDGPDLVPGDQSCDTGGLNAVGDPACSLRAAIQETNASGLIDRVEFAVPVADPGHSAGRWTISPSAPLPWVQTPITIDASTQPGHVVNTNPALTASNATMAVVLDGSSAGSTEGLVLRADASEARGLVINGFAGHGLVLSGARSAAAAVYVGTDATGTFAVANSGDGVVASGADAQIGGTDPADRVVVSGNGGQGIRVSSDDVSIRGSIVGLDAATTWPLPNGGNGVRLDNAAYAIVGEPGAGNVISGNNRAASTADGLYVTGGGRHRIQGNLIGTNSFGDPLGNYSAAMAFDDTNGTLVGGTGPGEGNTIRHNGIVGVAIRANSGDIAVLGNTINENGGLGIDHGQDGVTANDPADGDSGPNGLLNAPVITQASVSGSTVLVDFDLDVPAGDYRVEFFVNPAGVDGSGYGEGEVLVGATSLSHTGGGVEPFATSFAGSEGDLLTATATADLGPRYGSTSEFSLAVGAVDLGKVRVNSTGDASDLVPGDDQCDTGGLNAFGLPECTLRASIEEANASTVVDLIEFLIPVADTGYAGGVWTIRPLSALDPLTRPVTLDGTSQPSFVANTNPAPGALNGSPVVEVDGSGAGSGVDGLVVDATDVAVRGLVVNRFDNDAISVLVGADRFTVTASYLGTTASGLAVAPNADDGVDLGAADAVVGGISPADRNLVSGNLSQGLEVSLAATGSQIAGNVIGMNAAGTSPLPNSQHGVQVVQNATSNSIGGTAAGAANLISGNGSHGVLLTGAGVKGNIVAGNWIGTDVTGNTAAGNDEGVYVGSGATQNVIGPGNVVSGNGADGVYVGESSVDNRVIGNLIGLGADGVTDLGNADRGVQIETGAVGNIVGGPNAADRNVISGNGTEGVIIADFTAAGTTDNVVTNNFIGTDVTGGAAVPNTRDGVRVVASGGNLIGGVSPFDGNLIAYNGQEGVEISATALTDNAIMWNRIHSNGGLGIDIEDDGVTPNDAGDGDAGPNDLLNHPVITSATGVVGSSMVSLDFDLQPGDYLFHFHTNAVGADPTGFGEGQASVHARSLVGHPGGTGSLAAMVPVSPGQVITVTTTEVLGAGFGSTSEFSAAFTVTASIVATARDSSPSLGDLAFAGGLTPGPSASAIAGGAREVGGGTNRLVGPPTDNSSRGLSLSAWVQPKNLSGDPRLVAKSDGAGSPVYELLIDTSGSPQARARINLGGTVREAAGGTLTSAWHHVASTWDGATLRVFVDGQPVASTPAVGSLVTDPSIPLVVANTAGALDSLEGRLDEVRVSRVDRSADWVATAYASQVDPAGFVTVGALQTDAVGAWTVASTQTHGGSFAMQAPVSDALDSWVTADGLDERGVEFETWWWFSTTSAELAQGVRTGQAPVTQHESALVGPPGWDLGRIDPSGRTQDVAPPGGQSPATGTWTRVTVRIDQNDRMTVLLDDVVVIGPTPVSGAMGPGSLGLRGRLPAAEQWFVDDAVARRLVQVEPVASLGAMDRP